MHQLLPDVWTWSRLSEFHGYDFNGWFVRHPEGNLVIDPVEPDEQTLAALVRAGVTRILLTNRNHSRRANLVRERTGARVHMHPADAAHARAQGALIDDGLTPGERIGPFLVVAAAGKSPGEVAFHWPERRILVVGDVVIGNPSGRLGLLREQVMDHPRELHASVRRLALTDPDAILVGDGVPIVTGAAARLAELILTLPKDA